MKFVNKACANMLSKMLIILLLLVYQASAQRDYYSREINSVTNRAFAPTEQSSQDVLKELGVDLSNEGKPLKLKIKFQKFVISEVGKFLVYL